MDHTYKKQCVLQTDMFSVFYGEGIYSESNQREHYDADITVTYLKSARGEIKIEGNQYGMYSGDIIIMNSNELHCSRVEDNMYHERISICIDTSVLRRLVRNADDILDCFFKRSRGCCNVFPKKVVQEYGMDKLLEDVLSLSKASGSKEHILCSCRVVELLISLDNAFLHLKDFSAERAKENSMIQDVIEYINESFSEISNCEQLAQRFFVSRYHLEHLFREQVGIALWNYVILKRLLYAQSLLKSGEASHCAAAKSGFSNYSNFFRLYKKYMNATPTQSKKEL